MSTPVTVTPVVMPAVVVNVCSSITTLATGVPSSPSSVTV